jgi:hypothetical protein
MEEYLAYKRWWMENIGEGLVPSLYWGSTPERAFKQHVLRLGLYDLMETLAEGWVDRLGDKT